MVRRAKRKIYREEGEEVADKGTSTHPPTHPPIHSPTHPPIYPFNHPPTEEEAVCALKIVNKAAFWTRVAEGKERHDTLVRELVAQAVLTAHGSTGTSSHPPFPTAPHSNRLLPLTPDVQHLILTAASSSTHTTQEDRVGAPSSVCIQPLRRKRAWF